MRKRKKEKDREQTLVRGPVIIGFLNQRNACVGRETGYRDVYRGYRDYVFFFFSFLNFSFFL